MLAALAACTHGEPFQTANYGSDQPAGTSSPARLTTSAAADGDAAWLADESGFYYTGDRVDRGDVRCLMLLPPSGGRALRSLCPDHADTFNVYLAAAAGPGGRLAFVREDRSRGAPFPNRVELAVAAPESLGTPRVLQSIPFTLPGQPTAVAVRQVRWLGTDALIYRAGFDGFVCDAAGACGPGQSVFVSVGFGLVVQPVDPAAGGPAFVTGTDLASSVAVSPDGDAVYYTVTGQSKVYRLVRSTGVVTVVFDRPGSIVRDVQVAGNRLVAVVGGNVQYFVGQGVGPVQRDSGGDLYVVDIGSGSFTAINPPQIFFQHPALSPSGTRLVAESGGDLWLFNVP